MKNFFITATDTDAGKTFIACALTQALVNQNKKVAAYKPVAAGCQKIEGVLINEDAQLLSEFANAGQSIANINPITLEEAIAPHIAADHINQKITLDKIIQAYKQVTLYNADINLTEGAGGWRLPLAINRSKNDLPKMNRTSNVFLSDFAINTQQDIILVVNMKLGCLNHALLSYQAIEADGLNCIAWVANNANAIEMANLDENIASLEQLLPIPKIAQLNFYNDQQMTLHDKIFAAAQKINLTPLLHPNLK